MAMQSGENFVLLLIWMRTSWTWPRFSISMTSLIRWTSMRHVQLASTLITEMPLPQSYAPIAPEMPSTSGSKPLIGPNLGLRWWVNVIIIIVICLALGGAANHHHLFATPTPA